MKAKWRTEARRAWDDGDALGAGRTFNECLLFNNLGRILAAHVLQQIVYPNDEGAREALRLAAQSDDMAVRQAAHEALANLT